MARGSKDKYTVEQKRKAERIKKSYEQRGVPKAQAEGRAWATVNKQSGGGEKSGGSGQKTSASRKHGALSDTAKRAAKTRQGHSRDSSASLETQTKASLLVEARSRNIPGRSTMSKTELIHALQQ
ncbi:termination factor Rho [Pseudomonas sp. NPDC007930]|uniref:termination factor Rho n=1 Tax=Pseudomonas sp. NPDC007930 TaxID=3364417 RepID=UPI0036EBE50C